MIYSLWFIIIGVAAGWVSGKIMLGEDFDWIANGIVGILGAFVGNFIFGAIGINASRYSLGQLAIAIGGACFLIYAFKLLKHKI